MKDWRTSFEIFRRGNCPLAMSNLSRRDLKAFDWKGGGHMKLFRITIVLLAIALIMALAAVSVAYLR
jgi:hypothetical protein